MLRIYMINIPFIEFECWSIACRTVVRTNFHLETRKRAKSRLEIEIVRTANDGGGGGDDAHSIEPLRSISQMRFALKMTRHRVSATPLPPIKREEVHRHKNGERRWQPTTTLHTREKMKSWAKAAYINGGGWLLVCSNSLLENSIYLSCWKATTFTRQRNRGTIIFRLVVYWWHYRTYSQTPFFVWSFLIVHRFIFHFSPVFHLCVNFKIQRCLCGY